MSTHEVCVPYLDQNHTFYVVGNEFRVPENGIMGLPFFHAYKDSLINDGLFRNRQHHDLMDDGIIIPPNCVRMVNLPIKTTKKNAILMPLANPTDEYKILGTSEFDIRPTDTEFQKKSAKYLTTEELMGRVRELLECSRLNHIEQDTRETVRKIIQTYNDIFILVGDPLPCTNLTSHKIILEENRMINNKS